MVRKITIEFFITAVVVIVFSVSFFLPFFLSTPKNRQTAQKIIHFLFFGGSGGSKAARMASSNTFFNPF